MSVLDELRNAALDTIDFVSVEDREVELDAVFDAFEAAHPGLVDLTEKCRKCPSVIDGAVLANTLASEMTWVWSNGDKGYLCPACAKETT